MNSTNIRKTFALGSIAALALGLAACAPAGSNGGEDADSLTKVSVGSPTSIFSLGVRTAIEEGIFEENGLEVELVNIQAASEGAALLANGDIDFAQFDVHNTVLATSQGQDLIMTAPVSTTNTEKSDDVHGFGSLMVSSDGTIKTLKDLEGKKIGTNTIGGTAYLDFYQKLEQEGVDVETIEWIQVPSPQQVSAIKQGQIHASTTAEPNVSIGIASGDVVSIAQADDVMQGAPNFGLVSKGSWAEENSETVNKIQDALIEANKLLNSDPELARNMVDSYMDLDEDVLELLHLPHFAEKPFEPEEVKPVSDRLVEFKLIKEDEVPDPADVIFTN